MSRKPGAVEQNTCLRDRESGALFTVTGVGRRLVRYRGLCGAVRGEVRRARLREVFEVMERCAGDDEAKE